ncbi:butyrophilin subfamily 1 member A1-like [Solea senegalensis]|uniref:Butyrophilin subfamily 1 member A1-like n=1 Tax=Solea senegalensis TaxID=28829 RepID=A0AAV6QYR5_SOLSE|nr:butyrophilin subfamily 2 member A2-like [Solea senegalensis]KAG7496937.1 butyrophilin subfamily 1 member A1-like [Solea senegalensis]
MGLRTMIHLYLIAVLCASLSGAGPVQKGFVVLVSSSLSVHHGETTTLPCWLNPAQSAEGLEVRWYRGDHFDSPIIQIQHKRVESIGDSYNGRVSIGLRDAASGGLTTGDVSLNLQDVTLEDAGDYTCYVSSDQGYDRGSVSLNVTKTGTRPLLSAVWMEENLLNVSCESEGWYPQPWLRWSDHMRNLTPKSLQYSNIQEAFSPVSVHSWLLVSGLSYVSCSVGFCDEDVKEASVRLQGVPPQLAKGVAGWVAFALLLLAILVSLGVMYFLYFRNRVFQKKRKSGNSDAEENKKLLAGEPLEPRGSERLKEAETHYENITLQKKEHPYLKILNSLLRDKTQQAPPDGQEVTCLTAVKGASGFNSGQHYWEVSLERPGVAVKQSWWVGVTNAVDFSLDCNPTPSASSGFWFLSSSPDRADSLQVSSEPNVLLPVLSRPKTVGVYLEYEKGELSFYDVEEKNIIGSLTATFTGEVFPLFNPGKGDACPMEILQRTTQSEEIRECQS